MTNHLKLWTMGGALALLVVLAKQLTLIGIHPIHLAMLQSLGSMVFLAIFGTKGLLTSLRTQYRYYLIASVLGFTIPQLVVFYSVEHVGASVTALAYTFPLFLTYFLSHFVEKSGFSAKTLICVLSAFSGSMLFLYKPDVLNFNDEQLGWMVLLAIAPIAISLANIYRSRYFPVGVPIFHIALLTNTFSFLTYLLISRQVSPALPNVDLIQPSQYMTLLFFMAIAAVGQLLLFSLQKTAPPSFVGQTGSITAFFGGILGFVFFQESYQLTTLVGSLLIISGVTGFSRQQTSPPKKFKRFEYQPSKGELQ